MVLVTARLLLRPPVTRAPAAPRARRLHTRRSRTQRLSHPTSALPNICAEVRAALEVADAREYEQLRLDHLSGVRDAFVVNGVELVRPASMLVEPLTDTVVQLRRKLRLTFEAELRRWTRRARWPRRRARPRSAS